MTYVVICGAETYIEEEFEDLVVALEMCKDKPVMVGKVTEVPRWLLDTIEVIGEYIKEKEIKLRLIKTLINKLVGLEIDEGSKD